jgi:hypothetical protein
MATVLRDVMQMAPTFHTFISPKASHDDCQAAMHIKND